VQLLLNCNFFAITTSEIGVANSFDGSALRRCRQAQGGRGSFRRSSPTATTSIATILGTENRFEMSQQMLREAE
jgi:hypothetical protein